MLFNINLFSGQQVLGPKKDDDKNKQPTAEGQRLGSVVPTIMGLFICYILMIIYQFLLGGDANASRGNNVMPPAGRGNNVMPHGFYVVVNKPL